MAEREKFYTIKVVGDSATYKKLGDIEKQIKELTKANEELAKSEKSSSAELGKNLAQIKLLRQEKTALLKDTQNATNANNLEEGSILQLRAKLSEATKAYDSLSAAKRNSVTGKEMEADIAAQVAALNKLEQATGRYGRQVGNYNTAGVAMSQVLREIPAFTFSAQTGILALSNNIPILVDEMSRMAKSIDIVTKKEVGWKGAFKSMGTSLFSLGSVMTIALGLFTIFSDKIFAFISGEKEATKVTKQHKTAQDELNASMQNYANLMTNGFQPLQEVLQTLRNGTKNQTVSMSELNGALAATKKQLDDLKQTKNIIAGVWISGPEDRKLYNQRKNDLLNNMALIQAEIDKRNKEFNKKNTDSINKHNEDVYKSALDNYNLLLKLTSDYYDAYAESITDENDKAFIKEQLAYNKRIAELKSYYGKSEVITKAADRLIEQENERHFRELIRITITEYDDKAREENKLYKDEQDRFRDANEKLAKLAKDYADKRVADKKEEQKQLGESIKEGLDYFQQIEGAYWKLREQQIENSLKTSEKLINTNAETENQILKNRLDKGIDTEIQYAEKKAALDKKTAEENYKVQKEAFEKKKKLAKNQIIIDWNVATAATWANVIGNGGSWLSALAKSLVIAGESALLLAAVDAQEFATGGKVMEDRKNIPTKKNGDNVLTTLQVGEVVLNKKQQAALGGDSTFAAIGVPGFNSPNPSLYTSTSTMGITKSDMNKMLIAQARLINDKKVYNLEFESSRTRTQVQNYEIERAW